MATQKSGAHPDTSPLRSIAMLVLGAGLLITGVGGLGGPTAAASAQFTIVVAARPVAAGSVVRAADVRVQTTSTQVPGTIASTTGVIGSHAAVTLATGDTITNAELAPAPQDASRRVLEISVDSGDVPPGLARGDAVEVVESTGVGSARELGSASVIESTAATDDSSASAVVVDTDATTALAIEGVASPHDFRLIRIAAS